MGYFSYIADQAFSTSPTGERLFHPNGPWSRPYLITDDAAERELRKRHLLATKATLGTLIFGLPVLYAFYPPLAWQPLTFVGLLIVAIVAVAATRWIILRSDLRHLRKAPATGLHAHYQGMADKHSFGGLFLGFAGSLAFVAMGAWMYDIGLSPVIALFCVGFFGIASIGWVYSLFLKLRG